MASNADDAVLVTEDNGLLITRSHQCWRPQHPSSGQCIILCACFYKPNKLCICSTCTAVLYMVIDTCSIATIVDTAVYHIQYQHISILRDCVTITCPPEVTLKSLTYML
jgi:hypothetical protein